IEPREVEAALRAHPEVAQAAVAARPDGRGDRRLVGYVVPRQGGAVPAGLRRHLAARLPAYMLPTALVALDAMPLTSGGKVDTAALPDPPAAAPGGAPVRTELERTVAGVWRQVLKLDQVGADDNFFDLGGDSFALAAVHRALGELLGRRLPLVTLFEFPTVTALARHLQEDVPAAADDDHARGGRLRAGRDRLRDRRR
uniref:AMP-binding enzyme n=1 Tax=Nonomuraea lactucae TaxID=2249762 RepID=UPI001F059311